MHLTRSAEYSVTICRVCSEYNMYMLGQYYGHYRQVLYNQYFVITSNVVGCSNITAQTKNLKTVLSATYHSCISTWFCSQYFTFLAAEKFNSAVILT